MNRLLTTVIGGLGPCLVLTGLLVFALAFTFDGGQP